MQSDAKEVKNEVPAGDGVRARLEKVRRAAGRDKMASVPAGLTTFERRAEREIEFGAGGRVCALGLQVLDRMLRLDEERRADADSDDKIEGLARQRSLTTLYPVESLSSPGREPPFV